MDKKSLGNTLGLVLLCGVWFFIGWFSKEKWGGEETDLIGLAFNSIINESLYNENSPQELAYAAVRGMLNVVHDPYAELIEPEAAQDLKKTFAGETGVIGLYAENQNGLVVVQIVFPDSPAAQAGIKAGDVIVAIDGKELDEATDSSETGLLIRGEPETSVEISVLRNGELLEFEVLRQQRDFVTTKQFPDGVGYIALNAYNVTAAEEMQRELSSLLSGHPTAIIWDLRNNEGGDMQSAQRILSFFIEDGLLFTAEQTNDRVVEFEASGNALVPELPLIVLMDSTTYSAAETSAAVIEETGRGKTVGSTSYGKGIIQATMPLTDGAMLQMTIARWFSPSGVIFHERGVEPQFYVVDDPMTEQDEVLERALEVFDLNP